MFSYIINSCIGLSHMQHGLMCSPFFFFCCVPNSAESQTFSEDRIRWTGMTWETNQQKYQQTKYQMPTSKIINDEQS